jgi:hypothetical protein
MASGDVSMSHFSSHDLRFAMVTLALALLALFAWIPSDIESGLFERHRNTVYIGDALVPTVVCSLIALFSVLLLVSTWRHRRQPADAKEGAAGDDTAEAEATARWGADPSHLNPWTFRAAAFAVVGTGLVLLLYTGPLTVWLGTLTGLEPGSYRVLRDAVPWKYLGMLVGGTFMVSGLICVIEGALRIRSVVIGLAMSLLLVVLVDVPFDNLLLPPNGDF